MKKQMTLAMAAMLVFSTLSLHAQSATTAPVKRAAKTKKVRTAKAQKAEKTDEQRAIEDLQEKMSAQQSQIDALKQENAAKDAALAAAQSSAATATSQAAAATAQAQSAASATQTQADAVTGLKSTVTDLQTANVNLATTVSTTKTDIMDSVNSASALHYKGITITPGGFAAFEGVWRQRSVNSDINTPLNSIPFPSANEGHVSELNLSGRQSRLSALIQGNAGKFTLGAYYEMDWLGTGTSSNNNQSNSYVLRQRQIWGQVASKSGFTLTGGQMWSLVTEMRKGTDARTEIQPQTIDAQYLVGYSWTRQPELRIQQRWGDYKTGAFTAAVSVEQAQITSFTANGTNPAQYFFAGTGQNGGLYNAAAGVGGGNSASTSGITTYANNVSPDFIVKGAIDFPQFHAELGGVARFLRDFYYPVATYGGTASAPTYTYGSTYTSHTSDAGGIFGSARAYIGAPGTYPAVEVGLAAMAGTGVGRYGSAQLADATLRPDETLEPVKNYHGLASIESHLSPKLDVFAYYGGEYAQRTVYTVPNSGALIGYGTPNLNDSGCYNLPSFSGTAGSAGSIAATGSCASPTRYIFEPMIGFQYRPIVSAKYGKLQYSVTYSLLDRKLWSGTPTSGLIVTSSPRAENSMIHVQMRYYIP